MKTNNKMLFLISQTTDSHFSNYRFSFRFVPFRFVSFRFANYSKPKYTLNVLFKMEDEDEIDVYNGTFAKCVTFSYSLCD